MYGNRRGNRQEDQEQDAKRVKEDKERVLSLRKTESAIRGYIIWLILSHTTEMSRK